MPRAGGRGYEGLLNKYSVSGEDEIVLEVDSGDGYTMM